MDGTGLQEWLEKSDVDRPVRIASGIDTAAEAQFDGVRTGRWVYAEFPVTGERELYDLAEDPNELTNLAGSSDPRPGGGAAPEPVRLAAGLRRDRVQRARARVAAAGRQAGLPAAASELAGDALTQQPQRAEAWLRRRLRSGCQRGGW